MDNLKTYDMAKKLYYLELPLFGNSGMINTKTRKGKAAYEITEIDELDQKSGRRVSDDTAGR